jgi:hypothetical protein
VSQYSIKPIRFFEFAAIEGGEDIIAVAKKKLR